MKLLSMIVVALIMTPSPLCAEPIKVAGTEVSFEPPDGFVPLSKEIIAAKWPATTAPPYAVGTPSGTTTVAYDLRPQPLPQEALPEIQESFTETFERIVPGISWKKNEIVEHSGQKWLLMEMTSDAMDTDIYNILFITGFDGRMLVFNFNSTKEDFPKYEAALRRSLKSVRLPER